VSTEAEQSIAHAHDADHHAHLATEALTMALYVAVCLLAALIALGDRAEEHHVRAIALVWGTTIGLALAHLFAFRLAAKWISGGTLTEKDTAAALAQLAGAAGVAVIATIPIVLFGPSIEFDLVRLVLALLIGGAGFGAARSAGASTVRAALAGVSVLAVAVAVAVAKNYFSGH
jgi:hypothetical protein